ncbi:MAG: hypothetical protein F4Z28_02765 [Gammaproteobacteria bacterium]|nr:hypothetical protein [Gammaproteobacteria bacterium]
MEPTKAVGSDLGRAVSIGVAEHRRARRIAYCAVAERLHLRREVEEVLAVEQEFSKRVDALTFTA